MPTIAPAETTKKADPKRLQMTDAAVRKLKAPTDAPRCEYWDTTTKGLGLRVSQTGARSWVMIVRTLKAGEWTQQRVTLGNYPAVSLAAARVLAADAKTKAEQGQNPAGVPKAQRKAMEQESRDTFAAVRDEFLTKYRGRQNKRPAPRTLSEIKRVLDSDLFADWRDLPMVKVTKRDVLDVLDVLVERGSEVMANRTLAYLGMLCAWCVDREIIKADPTDGIKKPGAEQSRARVLSPAELRAIWQGVAPTQVNHGDLFAGIIRILMLTGQRSEEVAGMRWVELDGDTWTLPASRTKNGRGHIVPLSAPVLAILAERRAEQAAMKMQTEFVFTSFGPRPFSGWSKSKARLDGRANIAAWTIHDLRRTLATRMAEDLRIPPHVIEATINHVSGSRGGVAGTYNRALYLDERKTALDAWAGYVLRLVGDAETTNVVEFAKAG
ncbi:site-specific integrase [uncultured Thiodictyon sp.]|uniref:tyrosine-type recombinase/integrase n=1 Tax=uncultured Thiodictyon sp. TaxID=1846217 RepID=UPI0025F55292|nr:site-specific integrase [uncultured Thiodictyon sp.]